MFSRILAAASIVVPASQARGRTEANNTVRPPASEAALDGYDPADVVRVVLAGAGEHLVADQVQLAAEVGDVGLAEMLGRGH
jgi:hypothetical protein